MLEEQWRDILGYEGHYQISSFGRVKSLNRHIIHRFKEGLLRPVFYKERILSLRTYEYPSCELYRDRHRHVYRVHRLVAEYFVPGRNNTRNIVNHKDGEIGNNRADNLEWVTPEENMKHAHKKELILRGELHPFSKLTENDVKEIIRFCRGPLTSGQIAKKYGVSSSCVAKIRQRQRWRHVWDWFDSLGRKKQ